MPTSWKRTDDNALRAHLQEALEQRAASADATDRSYSDYDVAAIRAELNERQAAQAIPRDRMADERVSRPVPDLACESCASSRTTIDPEAARLRTLIARCFKPSHRQARKAGSREPGIRGPDGAAPASSSAG